LTAEFGADPASPPAWEKLGQFLAIPTETAAERRQKYIDGLRFRTVVSGSFIFVFWLLETLGVADGGPLLRALPYLLILGLINWIYWRIGTRTNFTLIWFFAHWAIDIVLISAILVALGGLEVPYGFLAYVMIIVTSATFVSKRASFVVAFGAGVATASIGVLELASDMTPPAIWGGEMDPATKLASVVFVLLFFFIFAYLAGTLADQLKVASNELIVARRSVEEQNRYLEDAVRRRTLELERRNTEVEEFVHVVTHDLRNVSVGVSELTRRLLQRDGNSMSPRGVRDVGRLLEDARRMNEMLSSLLAIFRVERDVRSPVLLDVGAVAESVIRAQADRLERKGIAVQVEALPAIRADASRLSHVIANLIDNAIKYVGDKPHPSIRIFSRPAPGGLELCIGDNGVGIEPEQRDRIFQLYHRAPQQLVAGELQVGEGVGLAMCKRIVERWGGYIHVESVVGVGSCFAVFLPDLPDMDAAETANGGGEVEQSERPGCGRAE
jgi:signal transduction histidine kinase